MNLVAQIKKTPRLTLYLLPVLVLGVFFVWNDSNAFTLYDQVEVSDTKSDCVDSNTRCMTSTSTPFGTTSGFEQYLGTGLIGNVSSVSFYAADDQWSVGSQPTIKVGIACYNTASVSVANYNASCSSSAYTISGVPRTNTKTLVETAIHSFSFDQSKYYTLAFTCTAGCSGGLSGNTNDKFYVYGSAYTSVTDYYTNGDFERDDRIDLGIDDIYFSIMSSQSNNSVYNDSRILLVFSPLNGKNYPCTVTYCDVTFSFTYNNADTYNRVGVIISDLTQGTTLNTIDFEHVNAITGQSSYVETASMHVGRSYTWQPYLRDTTGVLPQVNGGIFTFTVGDHSDLIGFEDFSIGSNSNSYVEFDVSAACNKYFPDTGSWLSISSYGNAFGRGICNGLGYTFIPSSSSFTDFKDNVFAVRDYFPVSTVTGVYDLALIALDSSDIASTSGYASLSFNDLDFDTRVSHSVDITIYRMASISEYIPQSSIDLVRNLFKYVLWFSFVMGWFYVLSKTLKLS